MKLDDKFELAFLSVSKQYPKLTRTKGRYFIAFLKHFLEENKKKANNKNFSQCMNQALSSLKKKVEVTREDKCAYQVLAKNYFDLEIR